MTAPASTRPPTILLTILLAILLANLTDKDFPTG